MKLNLFTQCLGICISLAVSVPGAAQSALPDTTNMVVVQTTDGNEFYGAWLSQDDQFIVLKTENFGDISIRKTIVKRIVPIDRIKTSKGRVWFLNRNAERYFAGTSGYGLRKGEGSFDNGWVLFNQVSYGISDQFAIGAGFAPLLIFDGPLPFWVTPKLSVPLVKNKLHVALGGLFGRAYSDYEDDNSRFGAVYTQLTLGSPDTHLTAGFGYGISNGSWSESPILSLNGFWRTGPRLALLFESYWQNPGNNYEAVSMFSSGVRFVGRRVSVDVSLLLLVIPDDGAYPIPWVGMHVPFGSGK